MAQFPPRDFKEWKRALRKLGFTEAHRVGKGSHAYKFIHPEKKTQDYRIQPNFIIIPHKIAPSFSAKIVKEVMFFGFTKEEVEEACK